MKFCENFYSSRISADKRFQKFKLQPDPLYPGPGLPQDGLQSQSYEYFKIKWQIKRDFLFIINEKAQSDSYAAIQIYRFHICCREGFPLTGIGVA